MLDCEEHPMPKMVSGRTVSEARFLGRHVREHKLAPTSPTRLVRQAIGGQLLPPTATSGCPSSHALGLPAGDALL
jgi:hypothetical protein